ncbi:hypothetical protein [Nocardioides sp. LML1-1-1.1]|uniref:hypothetical protein n=1 Tax=Nocardioides sp. LML1-1-1.1 TaxID=3135248 RepID=UPI00343AB456
MSTLARTTSTRRPLVVVPVDTTETDDPHVQVVIDAQRAIGCRTAVAFLVAGNRGKAHMELVRSVRRQWLLAFDGEMPLEPSRLPHERSTR